TQKDQDEADEEAQRKAMKDLVQSWMDRLQSISVVTTFFASTEAGQTTVPDSGDQKSMTSVEVTANAALVGALILHIFAAIVSFLASFYLIRYKLHVAKKEEVKAANPNIILSPVAGPAVDHDFEKDAMPTHARSAPALPVRDSQGSNGAPLEPPVVWTTHPHLVQVGPFQRQPPTNLLSRCHSLSIFIAAVGFILAMVGIVCFAWARLPRSVGAFASTSMGLCLVASVLILFY
ncbi:hypothetical protein PLICRDRAFT_107311, partial [Plicaturopsis crispa FD-325 SS-3]